MALATKFILGSSMGHGGHESLPPLHSSLAVDEELPTLRGRQLRRLWRRLAFIFHSIPQLRHRPRAGGGSEEATMSCTQLSQHKAYAFRPSQLHIYST
mmetsp:Transcript_3778/g.5644  ORF Transcript_3778/g.5644 Transcript_3778/m.5644 type:complete len:98 (-) Transcript_3778:373-666(-)